MSKARSDTDVEMKSIESAPISAVSRLAGKN